MQKVPCKDFKLTHYHISLINVLEINPMCSDRLNPLYSYPWLLRKKKKTYFTVLSQTNHLNYFKDWKRIWQLSIVGRRLQRQRDRLVICAQRLPVLHRRPEQRRSAKVLPLCSGLRRRMVVLQVCRNLFLLYRKLMTTYPLFSPFNWTLYLQPFLIEFWLTKSNTPGFRMPLQ